MRILFASLLIVLFVAPASAQSQLPEPWFRACGQEMVKRKFERRQAIFLCACTLGGVMVTNQLNRDQKRMIVSSPTFRPARATRDVGALVGRIFNGCQTRMKNGTPQ